MVKRRLLASMLAIALPALCAQAATAQPLRAGAAKASITPPQDIFPYTVPRERSFVGVHDDVFARALVLDDGKQRVVIVSLEVTTVPRPERLVNAVAKAAGVPIANVLIAATHTHNVPLVFYHGEVTNPSQTGEMDRVEQGAVASVRAAVAQLRPARLAWGRGTALVNTNNGEQANLDGWYDPKGSSDKSLDVLRVEDDAGKPLALMVNYATHGEVMFRSVTRDGGYEVSGDLPGAASHLLETAPAGAPVVLFTSGAEADQLPLFKSLQPTAQLPAADMGSAGWGIMELQARRLAASVIDTLAAMPPGVAENRIEVAFGAATCPGQRYDVERPSGKVLGVHDTPPVTIPLTAIRLGGVAIVGVGADIASDIGQAIKAASPAPQTTVVTMLAGSVGYVLNDAAFIKPGHGALGSPIKPGCAAQALSQGAARMLGKAGQ